MSYGSNDEEKPRKAFLRGGPFLGNEYEKSLHIDKGENIWKNIWRIVFS